MTSTKDQLVIPNGQCPNSPGSSPIERLPNELLHKILTFVIAPSSGKYWLTPHRLKGDAPTTVISGDAPTTASSQRLMSCLFASKTLSSSALFLMYREPQIEKRVSSASSSISQFFATIEQIPQLGNLVRSLEVTKVGLDNNFKLSTRSLSALPHVRDIRLSLSHISDAKLLQTLLFDIPQLESLAITISDMSESESKSQLLRHALDSLPANTTSALTTLKITGSDSGQLFYIPDEFFSNLLPRLSNLRVLDLSKTCVTSEILATISTMTRLIQLNISGCTHLSPSSLITFVTTHSAIRFSLTILNAGSITYEGTALQEHHISDLLTSAPPTLRSLDLSNSDMGPSNVPHLRNLCCGGQLEELSVGGNLLLDEIEEMLLTPRYDYATEQRVSSVDFHLDSNLKPTDDIRYASILKPMKAAVAMCKLRQRLDSVKVSRNQQGRLFSDPGPESTLKYLDISSISKQEQGQIKQSVLMGKQTSPLEVIEMRHLPWDDYLELPKLCRSAGWREQWEGDRIWIERIE